MSRGRLKFFLTISILLNLSVAAAVAHGYLSGRNSYSLAIDSQPFYRSTP